MNTCATHYVKPVFEGDNWVMKISYTHQGIPNSNRYVFAGKDYPDYTRINEAAEKLVSDMLRVKRRM